MKEPKEQNVVKVDKYGNKFKMQFDFCDRCRCYAGCYYMETEDVAERFPHYLSEECGDDIE